MSSIFDIRIQRLFLLTLILKVASSGIGWYFQLQWLFGFGIPITLMGIYIWVGINRQDSDVSDEKFADSCYYLGFIFTITSIIFSLFDLPNIGTQIQDIAVRFGAAMVSTVLGLGVRVYLVSFGKEVADAIKDAEEGIIEASQRFQLQLVNAVDKFRDFEMQVDNASKGTVERINMQVETLSKNHSEKLAEFFNELTIKNQESFTLALAEVRNASQALAQSVDKYSLGMGENLASIEAKVGSFADAVNEKLKTTVFPDDFFSSRLEGPLSNLANSTDALSRNVMENADSVGESNVTLTSSLKKMSRSAAAAEKSLDTVGLLSTQQQVVLDASQGQLNTITQIGSVLEKVNTALDQTLTGLSTNQTLSAELSQKIADVVDDGAQTRQNLTASLSSVSDRLADGASATQSLHSQIEKSIDTTGLLIDKLTASAAVTSVIVSSLENITLDSKDTSQRLHNLNEDAHITFNKASSLTESMKTIVSHLSTLDEVTKLQNGELKSISNGILKLIHTAELPIIEMNAPDEAAISSLHLAQNNFSSPSGQ